jgi:hypothetical protein
MHGEIWPRAFRLPAHDLAEVRMSDLGQMLTNITELRKALDLVMRAADYLKQTRPEGLHHEDPQIDERLRRDGVFYIGPEISHSLLILWRCGYEVEQQIRSVVALYQEQYMRQEAAKQAERECDPFQRHSTFIAGQRLLVRAIRRQDSWFFPEALNDPTDPGYQAADLHAYDHSSTRGLLVDCLKDLEKERAYFHTEWKGYGGEPIEEVAAILGLPVRKKPGRPTRRSA